jgi:hypothetical protein
MDGLETVLQAQPGKVHPIGKIHVHRVQPLEVRRQEEAHR